MAPCELASAELPELPVRCRTGGAGGRSRWSCRSCRGAGHALPELMAEGIGLKPAELPGAVRSRSIRAELVAGMAAVLGSVELSEGH